MHATSLIRADKGNLTRFHKIDKDIFYRITIPPHLSKYRLAQVASVCLVYTKGKIAFFSV